MSDHQRLRREEPARNGPVRNWSTLYRDAKSGEAHDSSASPQATDEAQSDHSLNDVVSHGVKLGYQVVEEHIRQGQRVAEQINNRSYNPENIGKDVRELVERMVHYYTDLGSLWGDLANSLLADPDLLRNLFRGQAQAEQPATRAAATAASPTATLAVSIEVISPRPTQVTLDLQPRSEGLPLTTYGLHAGDAQKPSLTDITFESGLDTGRLLLRIRVPEGQPPDVYTGVVVDKGTNLPRGTLSVRLVDE
ncbi:MAG: hypothetical protein HY268_13790 [Deltaproteobacteria bacterium]|nr:hypothetical protein [Deltaproteobacteria bacterium]